ncbi:MAG: virulence factor MviN [Arcanobacterium sp.]|nr:virulence factor MviN [Arcanobacterium sp.]MDY5589648.1 lipid II flippase MurJ [Arcanobacterium sp.]
MDHPNRALPSRHDPTHGHSPRTAAHKGRHVRHERTPRHAHHTHTPSGHAPGSAHRQPPTHSSHAAQEHDRASVARSSLIMASGTFVSRVLGMIRSPFLLTMVVGLNSPIANAFDIANTLPNLLFNFLASGIIDSVLVPAIVRASNSADGGRAYLNKLFTITLVFLGSITVLLTVGAPVVVKVWAATLSPQWYQITVMMAYWCIPQILFYGLTAVFGQILNAREVFGPYMWVPVANNVVAIGGFLALLWIFGSPSQAQLIDAQAWIGPRSLLLAVISTVGIALQVVLLLFPMRRLGIRLRLDFHWRGAGLRTTGKASLWAIASSLVFIPSSAVLTNVAAGATQRALTAGLDLGAVAGNAAYNVAYALFMMPISLVSTSIITAMFTRMAKSAASENLPLMRAQVIRTANSVAVINYLAMAMLIIFALPLSRVFVPRGSAAEISTLAVLIVILSFSVIPWGLMLLFDRVGYSFEDTRGPFIASLPAQAFTVVGFFCCGFLPPQLTIPVVALVAVSSTHLTMLLVGRYAQRKLKGLRLSRIVVPHLKIAAVAAGVTAIALGVLWVISFEKVTASFGASVLTGIVGAPIVAMLYLLLLVAFRIPQAEVLLSLLKRVAQKLHR